MNSLSSLSNDSVNVVRHGHIVKVNLVNCHEEFKPIGKQKNEGYYNYMIGNNKSAWASKVGLYKKVLIKSRYEGIDLQYYFDGDNIRYDYIVNPNALPSAIEIEIEGAEKNYINEQGELVFTTEVGDIKHTKLLGYQLIEGKKEIVPANFNLTNDKTIGFDVGHYNKNYPLVIDPVVYFYAIMGSGMDKGLSIVADGSQNTYVAGFTASSNFPITAGAYQTTYPGPTCGFVSKVDASGSTQIYCTFLGGTFGNVLYGIDIDQATGNGYELDVNGQI